MAPSLSAKRGLAPDQFVYEDSLSKLHSGIALTSCLHSYSFMRLAVAYIATLLHITLNEKSSLHNQMQFGLNRPAKIL